MKLWHHKPGDKYGLSQVVLPAAGEWSGSVGRRGRGRGEGGGDAEAAGLEAGSVVEVVSVCGEGGEEGPRAVVQWDGVAWEGKDAVPANTLSIDANIGALHGLKHMDEVRLRRLDKAKVRSPRLLQGG